jgi:hypothetical protein
MSHHALTHHQHQALQHARHAMLAEHSRRVGRGSGGSISHYAHEIPGLPGYDEMVNRYSVTNEKWEVIRQSLYDSNIYPGIGTGQLTFFAVQKGQGVGFGGGAKTLSDTNMTLSGQIPTNQSFLVKTIALIFQPVTPTVAAQLPSVGGVAAANAATVNDPFVFWRAGNLVFIIGSKPYLEEAPCGKFPPLTSFNVQGALSDSTTPAAAGTSRIAYANQLGRPYHISPADLRLEANMNFSITLNWPEGAQALPSGSPGRVFCVLDGLMYRRSQ